MSRDVGAFLSAQQASSSPEIQKQWAEFEELYNKRLWHQLTVKLLQFVKEPHMQQGDNLLKLYENFIMEFENKINLLSLVEIVSCVVKQIPDYDKCITCLSKTKERVKANPLAVILCNVIIGRLMLQKPDLNGVKKLIEETNALIDEQDGVTQVHGRFFQLSSDYHQVMGNHANYYRDALRYLGCIELKTIPLEEQQMRAFTLCLAALLGENVYNFGELLSHPILDSVAGTDKNWVVELLRAFNSGSLARFETLRPQWTTQPDLCASELALRQKICLLCLMEMTFKKSNNQRVLTFQDVATETRLPIDEVELLVMKALSLDLVRGSIDQVDQKIHMSWVQPRVLDKEQITTMKKRLDQWAKDVKNMEILLENKAQEIILT